MESTNNNTTFVSTDNNSNTNTNPNPRKPNLPPKFQKYLAFAFFFSNLLNDNNLLLDNNLDNALSLFYAFDSIDSQSSFFHSFEIQFKPLLKSFKLLLKEREKANKPKKTKKTNKKNTTATTDEPLVNNEEASEHTEKPKKQRKSKKTIVSETTTNNEETSETTEKPKKQRKSKKEKKGSQDTEEKSDLIHELLTLANSEPDEV
jgi:hypothetical protein